MELALLGLHEQRDLQQALEHILNMINMFLLRPGENQDVIQVDECVFVQHGSQNIIDESLKNAWGIGEAEGHEQVLIVSSGCVEGSLQLVPPLDLDQKIGVAKIQLGENCSPLKQFEGRSNEWEGVTILDSDVIEAPVVDAGTRPSFQ